MKFDSFIGQDYPAVSSAISVQRSMNLYLEAEESHDEAKSARALVGTPGISNFSLLPTSPIRGIWTGIGDTLPDTTSTDLCYVVSGAKLYQVVSNGGYALLGDVGDDATHSPVTMQVNGAQIFITSAGVGWVWNGTTLARALFNNGQGTVSTAGTAVTWLSGDQFDVTLIGSGIVIGSTAYVIAAYVDSTHITLAGSAGTQASAAYKIMAAAGTVSIIGGFVIWQSGNQFTGLLNGDPILIGGNVCSVTGVFGPTALTATGIPGVGVNLAYQSNAAVQAAMSAFLDTYFVALPSNSKTFNISAVNDGTSWNPLDFGRKEGFPDNIQSILGDHEELWLFGTETTEIWRNTGNADFPFQRDPGAFIHQGIRAPFSAVSLANGVAWLGGDVRGGPIAWRAEGYQPVRISTHAEESAWAQYSTVTDARAYVYVEGGHQFWVINFPTANATWVYDATAGTWHERGWWNGASDDRQRQWCHGYAFGKHIVGDWATGQLYLQSLAFYSDAGTARHYFRTAPHLTDEERWTFYSRFRLSMQAGPSPTLAWANDLGVTFNSARAASSRSIGGATQSSEWRRLGRGRDRVWRVDILDSTHQIVLVACYLDIGAGNG